MNPRHVEHTQSRYHNDMNDHSLQLIVLQTIHLLLWFAFVILLARSRLLSDKIDIGLTSMKPLHRWFLVPVVSLVGGGTVFALMVIFWRIFRVYVEPSASRVLALFLVYMSSSYVFVAMGAAAAPVRKNLVCGLLAVILFVCFASMLYMSNLHLSPPEYDYYYLCYSLAAFISISAGVLAGTCGFRKGCRIAPRLSASSHRMLIASLLLSLLVLGVTPQFYFLGRYIARSKHLFPSLIILVLPFVSIRIACWLMIWAGAGASEIVKLRKDRLLGLATIVAFLLSVISLGIVYVLSLTEGI